MSTHKSSRYSTKLTKCCLPLTHTYTQSCTHVDIYKCALYTSHMHTHIHACMHVYTHIHTWVHIYSHWHTYTHVHVSTHIYTCIHMHTGTQIQVSVLWFYCLDVGDRTKVSRLGDEGLSTHWIMSLALNYTFCLWVSSSFAPFCHSCICVLCMYLLIWVSLRV